jgi:hypothetical protein
LSGYFIATPRRGQRRMSQVLGAFGLLDFTMLRPVLAWRTFWNLRTVYFFNFPFFFRAAVNRGWLKPRILNQQIRGHNCTFEMSGANHTLTQGHMLADESLAILLHVVMTVSMWVGPALVLNGNASCCCWDSSSSTSTEQISSHDKSSASASVLLGQHPDMQQLDSTRKSPLFSTDLPAIAPGTVLGDEPAQTFAVVILMGHCLGHCWNVYLKSLCVCSLAMSWGFVHTEVLTFWPYWSDLLSLSVTFWMWRQSVTPQYLLTCLTSEYETMKISFLTVSASNGSRFNTII